MEKSKLSKIVNEAIQNNLYKETLGGGKLGESDNYRGCKTIKIIWHGEHADPELYYNGKSINYYNIEDDMVEGAKDEGIDINDEAAFSEYCKEHEAYIQDVIATYGEDDDREKNPFENKSIKQKTMNEQRLKQIISESIHKVLNEGMTTDNPNYEKWEHAREILGTDRMLDAVFGYLDVSQLEKIVGWLYQDYELDNEEEEEDIETEEE